MKHLFSAALIFSTLATISHAEDKAMQDPVDRYSYAIGTSIGGRISSDLQQAPAKFNTSMIAKGVSDAITGAKLVLTEEEIQAALADMEKSMKAKASEAAAANKATGEKFLAENKKKDGVKTTASGLQYKVVSEGKGTKPKDTDNVTVHYKGTFIDGKEFDSSYKRNEPASFPLNGVIKGWTEGLQLMTPGSKYQFFIPSDLAYGEEGRPGIEPNSTLVFDVELVSVDKPTEATTEPVSAPKAK